MAAPQKMDMACFMRQAKVRREDVRCVPSLGFLGPDGEPVEWVVHPLTTEEFEQLSRESVAPSGGLDGMALQRKLIVRSVVYPVLDDRELQDSWGARSAEQLVVKMLSPGEYGRLAAVCMEAAGLSDFGDRIQTAKN